MFDNNSAFNIDRWYEINSLQNSIFNIDNDLKATVIQKKKRDINSKIKGKQKQLDHLQNANTY